MGQCLTMLSLLNDGGAADWDTLFKTADTTISVKFGMQTLKKSF